ncbi:MAG: hypothetical protein MUF31_10685 [Akkermansiaceae bacterium]|nr:hypothetical protein [Akkermansiaceae bacterium]
MKFNLLSLFAASLFLAGCGMVPSQKVLTPEQRFAAADKEGTGRVSRERVVDLMIEDAFKRYDSDKDGFVTEAEYLAGGGTSAGFRKINTSGTGKATLAETQACKVVRDTMSPSFDEADTNRDGYATLAEYQAYLQRRDSAVR